MQDNTKIVSGSTNNDFGQTGKFVRENQKSLLFIVAAVVLLAAGYLIYLKLYLAPREVEAANKMHVAQDYWEKKDWDKAINGDAGYPGFEKIINEHYSNKEIEIMVIYMSQWINNLHF